MSNAIIGLSNLAASNKGKPKLSIDETHNKAVEFKRCDEQSDLEILPRQIMFEKCFEQGGLIVKNSFIFKSERHTFRSFFRSA